MKRINYFVIKIIKLTKNKIQIINKLNKIKK